MISRLKNLTLFLSFFLTLKAVSPIYAANEKDEIELAIGEWFPFVSEKLEHYGILPYIVEEAFLASNVKVNYSFYPWSRALYLAKKGKLDGTAGWYKHERFAADFLLSSEILKADNVFFHLKSFKVSEPLFKDFGGITIGGVVGYTSTIDFERKFIDRNVNLELAHGDLQNFFKLLAGRVQLVIAQKEVGYALIKSKIPKDAYRVTHFQKSFFENRLTLLLSKKRETADKFNEQFNRGLEIIKKNGTYQNIIKNSWYSQGQSEKNYLPKIK